MKALFVLAVCAALAGCVTPAVKIQCLPLKAYTAAEDAEALAEGRALQQFPEIAAMLTDYETMRKADRACLAAKP